MGNDLVQNSLTSQQRFVRECYLRARHEKTFTEAHPDLEVPPADLDSHIPSMDGGVDDFGRQHRSVWPKLTEFLVQNKLSPMTYINTVMRMTLGRPKPPSYFYSNLAKSMFSEHRVRVQATLEHQERLQTSKYNNEYLMLKANPRFQTADDSTLASIILGNHVNGLSPVFRFCLATRLLLDNVKRDWYAAAVDRYIYNSDLYDRLFGELIPVELKAAVAAIQPMSPRYSVPSVAPSPVACSGSYYRPVQD